MPAPRPISIAVLNVTDNQAATACLEAVRVHTPAGAYRLAGDGQPSGDGPAVLLDGGCLVGPGWLEPLEDALAQGAEAAAPLCLESTGGPVSQAGVAFDPLSRPRALYAGFPADHPAPNRQRRVQAAAGAVALCAEAMKSLEAWPGGPDWHLDLGLRLKQAGSAVHLAPASRVVAPIAPERLFLEPEPAPGFAPDLHELVLADGLAVALNEWLHLSVRLNLDLETRLDRKHLAGTSIEALEALVREHPLWEGGLLRLAELYEDGGRFGEATARARDTAAFFPGLGNYRRLLGLAGQSRDHFLAGRAAEALSNALRILDDPAPLTAQARTLAEHPALAPLYRHWINNLVDIF